MSALDRPTILVVGGGERMQKALEVALERHDLMVESAPTESIVEAAFAAAPDLLLMLGDATADGGVAALSRLSGHPAAALVPVVLLLDEGGPETPVGPFRHGVVAIVRKTASADGMAREIAQLAQELPERSGEVAGDLGEATVDELVRMFSQQLRSGILSVSSGDGKGPSTQLVIRAGQPVSEAIEGLVERLRPLVRKEPGPLRYEFHESPDARLSLFDEESEEGEESDGALDRRRVLLIEQNPARADQLVQELRMRGALVVVADGDGTGLERARAHDPDVVILDGSGVESWAMDALRQLRRDPRLRWASLLVVDAKELWPESGEPPTLARLERSVAALMKPDRDLAERTQSKKVFETRLELVGPGRLLRALTATGLGLKVTTRHPRVRIEIDIAEELVAGARAFNARGDKELAEGPAAISAWLGLGSGRVRVEHKEAPTVANVMSPVDDALAAAGDEESPVRPSLPPPAPVSLTPPANITDDASSLLLRLEALLGQLTDNLPAGASVAPPPPPGRLPPPAALPSARLPAAPAFEVDDDDDNEPTIPIETQRQRWDSADLDDDIPVIEATAEPGALSEAPRVRSRSLPAPPEAELAESVPPPPPSNLGRVFGVLAALVVIGAGGAGAWWFFSRPPVDEGTDPVALPVSTHETEDAGEPDAPDAGAPDAGPAMDAGPGMDADLEAGAPEALAEAGVEAGLDEAGVDEAGVDGGEPDAGVPDAGGLDGGTDAGPELVASADPGESEDSRPPDVRYHLRSGNYARNQGDLRDAERHYVQVLRIQPRNPRALAGLARVAIARRDGNQAVRWAQRLVRFHARNPNNHVLLGDAYRVAGQGSQARAEWQRALELSPGHRRATERLGGG